VALIPERPFLWMTERQRQELRLQASRTVVDFAAADAGSRRDLLDRRGGVTPLREETRRCPDHGLPCRLSLCPTQGRLIGTLDF